MRSAERLRVGSVGGERVEGVRAVKELLAAGRRRVRRVVVAAGAADDSIVELARARGARVEIVEPAQFRRLARTTSHQGVLADCAPAKDMGLEGIAAASLVVVVDHLEDPHNLGAIVRSAAGLGAEAVVLARHRAVALTPAATKVAAGGVEWLRFATVSSVPQGLRRLGQLGFWRVGLDAEGSTSIFDLAVASEPVALVVGSEGRGVSPLTRRELDVVASIPMAPTVASLNAAVAASIALAAIAEARRRQAGTPAALGQR
jgi:23S rRNA (guanosine2251-2'-O)-methyltransferase